MKVKVIEQFRDKHDHETMYKEGTILEVQDENRAKSLIDRKLAKEFKGNQKAALTLTEPVAEAGDQHEPDTTGEGGQSDAQDDGSATSSK